MVVLAIYNILLSRLSGMEDIVVGTPVAGRRHAGLERVIGVFINTLPIRNYPTGSKTVKAFLKEVKNKTLEAFENQDYPFEDLVKRLAIDRELDRNPLFEAAINFLNPTEAVGGVNVSANDWEEADTAGKTFSNFDLSLYCIETGEEIHGVFKYRAALFKPATIKRFVDYYRKIIRQLSGDIEQKISDVEILSSKEKRELLERVRENSARVPGQKSKVPRQRRETLDVQFDF
jgi:non-ribosomal peptide synthetase component F